MKRQELFTQQKQEMSWFWHQEALRAQKEVENNKLRQVELSSINQEINIKLENTIQLYQIAESNIKDAKNKLDEISLSNLWEAHESLGIDNQFDNSPQKVFEEKIAYVLQYSLELKNAINTLLEYRKAQEEARKKNRRRIEIITFLSTIGILIFVCVGSYSLVKIAQMWIKGQQNARETIQANETARVIFETEQKTTQNAIDAAQTATKSAFVTAQIATQYAPEILSPHIGYVRGLDWSPDGASLASVGGLLVGSNFEGANIIIWQANQSNLLFLLKLSQKGNLRDVDWSPDGELLATASDTGEVIIWNVDNWTQEYAIPDSTRGTTVVNIAWEEAGEKLLILKNNNKIISWDKNSGQEKQEFELPVEGRLIVAAWSPDGEHLAMGDDLGNVIIWNLGDGSLEKKRTWKQNINAIDWSPDSTKLAIGKFHNIIVIWDVFEDLLDESINLNSPSRSLAWSFNGDWLASGNENGTVTIMDTHKQYEQITYSEHTDIVFCLDWSPDSISLASGSKDNTIRIWEVRR